MFLFQGVDESKNNKEDNKLSEELLNIFEEEAPVTEEKSLQSDIKDINETQNSIIPSEINLEEPKSGDNDMDISSRLESIIITEKRSLNRKKQKFKLLPRKRCRLKRVKKRVKIYLL